MQKTKEEILAKYSERSLTNLRNNIKDDNGHTSINNCLAAMHEFGILVAKQTLKKADYQIMQDENYEVLYPSDVILNIDVDLIFTTTPNE